MYHIKKTTSARSYSSTFFCIIDTCQFFADTAETKGVRLNKPFKVSCGFSIPEPDFGPNIDYTAKRELR